MLLNSNIKRNGALHYPRTFLYIMVEILVRAIRAEMKIKRI